MARRKPHRRRKFDDGYADPVHPEWLDGRVPNGFWNDVRNHRRYMTWLGKRLGFRNAEDWYRISADDFRENRGWTLLARYGWSPRAAVEAHFPRYPWCEWLFREVSNGFWDNSQNQRRYLDWLAEQLDLKSPDHWYQVSHGQFEAHHGSALLTRYGYSRVKLLEAHFPEVEWLPWRFETSSRHYWSSRANRRWYVEWLGRQLGYRTREDWYQIAREDFNRRDGATLICQFGGLFVALLRDVWPQYDWLEWRFRQVPKGFWSLRENRRRYLAWLGGQLGFRTLADWYRVKKEDFGRLNGAGLIGTQQDRSVSAIVMDAFPEFDWKPWLFTKTPRGYWNELAHRRRYLRWLARRLNLRRPDDWYGVQPHDFERNHGQRLVVDHYQRSVLHAARELFPRRSWDAKRFQKGRWPKGQPARRHWVTQNTDAD